jgi:glycosyltransferase involved in cell wall biosynthesis
MESLTNSSMENLVKILWAYRNKFSNKLFGTAFMPACGKKKGTVLLSYLPESFTHTPKEGFATLHTADFECYEMARQFSIRGYAVDIIKFTDTKFIPRKTYTACVDIHQNLERLRDILSKDCKKVMHVVGSYGEFQNNAEQKRLDDLEKRRGIKLQPRRTVPVSPNPNHADFMEGFGNATVHETYKQFGKQIFHIPISTVQSFDFPENKNWDTARKNFLWFGGGGMVHKGLDLTLEAFMQMPNLHLHICGPILAEKDFIEAYKKELYESPNVTVHGRIDPTSETYSKITSLCASTIHLSSSEGTSGAVVQMLHSGLIPIITSNTGILPEAGGIILNDPTVESIQKTIENFSNLPIETIKKMAFDSWSFAHSHYTREEFAKAYGNFIEHILKL